MATTTTETPKETTLTPDEQAAAAAAAEAAAKTEVVLTQEQKEANDAYQRSKFLHLNQYGPDPDKEIVKLPDGEDDRGRPKFKEWDFRRNEEEEAAAAGVVEREAAERAERESAERKAKAAAKAKVKPAGKTVERPSGERKKESVEERDRELERVAASAAAETAKRMTVKAGEKLVEAEGFTLPAREQRMLAVFHEMEKADPALKGLAGRHITFWKKAAKYAETWQEQNPGKVFNPNDDEHSGFYTEEPGYDQDVFSDTQTKTLARTLAKEIAAEEVGKTNAKVREMEVRGRMREEHGQVVELAQGSKAELIAQAAPELFKSVAGDGQFELTEETVDKLEAEDPMAFKVLNETADELGWQVVELERLSRYPETYRMNGALAIELPSTMKLDAKGKPIPGSGRKIYPHKELLNFVNELQGELQGDVREGKAFLTQADWSAKVDEILKSDKSTKDKQTELRSMETRHWRLESDDIRIALVAAYSQRARDRIAELNEYMGLREKTSTGQKTGAAAAAATAGGVKNGVVKVKVKPPASASASDNMDTSGAKPMTDEEKVRQIGAVY